MKRVVKTDVLITLILNEEELDWLHGFLRDQEVSVVPHRKTAARLKAFVEITKPVDITKSVTEKKGVTEEKERPTSDPAVFEYIEWGFSHKDEDESSRVVEVMPEACWSVPPLVYEEGKRSEVIARLAEGVICRRSGKWVFSYMDTEYPIHCSSHPSFQLGPLDTGFIFDSSLIAEGEKATAVIIKGIAYITKLMKEQVFTEEEEGISADRLNAKGTIHHSDSSPSSMWEGK